MTKFDRAAGRVVRSADLWERGEDGTEHWLLCRNLRWAVEAWRNEKRKDKAAKRAAGIAVGGGN